MIEFALVAPIFLALLFAIVEVAIMFFAGQVLETTVQDSSRVIRTGQAQSGGVAICKVPDPANPGQYITACSQATFKQLVCNNVPALFDCSKLYVDVKCYTSGNTSGCTTGGFGQVALSSHINSDGTFNPTTGYNAGGADDIVVVQLFYLWPQFVTKLGFKFTNIGDQRLLVGTAVFKNEPFSGGGS